MSSIGASTSAQEDKSEPVLNEFKVNSYEDAANEYDKWIIEFEEPIDDNQLKMIDTNGTATLEGGVLYFPIEEKDDYKVIYLNYLELILGDILLLYEMFFLFLFIRFNCISIFGIIK